MLLDGFCDSHLNDEYKVLCRKMAVILVDAAPEILRGKPAGWAAGIVYALGHVNFLNDPEASPHVRTEDIARGFGVSVATMHSKARMIREAFELMPFHPDWCLPSLLEENPLVWMLNVNGFLCDIRMMPREAQLVAYEKGLIPYIPADRPAAKSGAPTNDPTPRLPN